MKKTIYYWDSCVWISIINNEVGRVENCNYIIECAQRGEVEIWTSTFTLTEVVKRKINGQFESIALKQNKQFEDYLEQDFIVRINLDSDIGNLARRVLQKYQQLKKPADAVHVASALLNNVDEFHTYDENDILPLDNLLEMENGRFLRIKKPPTPPDHNKGTLFEGFTNAQNLLSSKAK